MAREPALGLEFLRIGADFAGRLVIGRARRKESALAFDGQAVIPDASTLVQTVCIARPSSCFVTLLLHRSGLPFLVLLFYFDMGQFLVPSFVDNPVCCY